MKPERERMATTGETSGAPPDVHRRAFFAKAAQATLAGVLAGSTSAVAQAPEEPSFDPAMEVGEHDAVTQMRRDVQRSMGKPARERRWGMVIDLHRCVGCSACDIACKRENNVPHSFAWSNHILETRGTFPDTQWRYIPTMCNHCTDAPCIANCPTTAMRKSEDGLTLHEVDLCIGCRACQLSCPYGAIYYNDDKPHADILFGGGEAIPNVTTTGEAVADMSGTPLPVYNPAREATLPGVRPKGVVEKCTMCDHRLAQGDVPACVEACPADARIFGDLNDPESAISRILATHRHRVLQPDKGTRPNVFYIRDF
jgi:molybdopterin-containing oxidoreductase family iron-sulfur binding subunit